MDPAVIKYYRNLLKNGFLNAGSFENPTIFLDSVGENLPVCGKLGQDFVHVFINMQDDRISDIRYLCNCDPTANVVFEIMCGLLRGITIAEFRNITPESFYQAVGSSQEELAKRVKASLELINRGITRYQNGPLKAAERS
jgi:NifU-like protein involved in Fe-S cluster formation